MVQIAEVIECGEEMQMRKADKCRLASNGRLGTRRGLGGWCFGLPYGVRQQLLVDVEGSGDQGVVQAKVVGGVTGGGAEARGVLG